MLLLQLLEVLEVIVLILLEVMLEGELVLEVV